MFCTFHTLQSVGPNTLRQKGYKGVIENYRVSVKSLPGLFSRYIPSLWDREFSYWWQKIEEGWEIYFRFFFWLKFLLKNNLLKNVTFFSLNKKLKLKMHSMNLFWAIMGYTEKHKDINKVIRDAKGGMRRYWNLMEDSRGTLECPERGLALEGFLKVILGCTDRTSPTV
jgi:hypothetical protein